MKHPLVIWPIFLLLVHFAQGAPYCIERNFAQLSTSRNRSEGNNDFIIYGITQDCQIFFARLGDYSVFRGLSTTETITHCNPNLVKLHIRRYENGFGLLLVIKQPNNKLCTLPIEFPHLSTLSGRKVFSYTLLSTLKFATCSHTSDRSRSTLVPDLSFFDNTFSDIVYFIDETSVGPIWTLRQFQLLPSGYLKPLDIYDMKHPAFDPGKPDAYANDNMLQSDAKSLYIWNRSQDQLHSTCAFDAIFRPKTAKTKTFKVQRQRREWLNSFSVDKSLIVYAESTRTSDMHWATNIYASNLSKPGQTVCIGHTNVLLDVNVISVASLLEMKRKNFSLFGNRTLEKATTTITAKPTTSASPSTTTAKARPPKLRNKQHKVADYDYSNSIFNSELGYIINLGNLKTSEISSSSSRPSTASTAAPQSTLQTVNTESTKTPVPSFAPNATITPKPQWGTSTTTLKVDLPISESGKISPDQLQHEHHYEISATTTTEQPTSPKIDPAHDTSSKDKMVNDASPSRSVIFSLLHLVLLFTLVQI
ncbi:hypothetical protein QR680_002576 [Steinernema hermaphroditum]|uniref:Uncharacterized protein n=1 Tax=Steinernema hermaphroditum TaxID=289476 RepID=A0AA39H4Z4_9BILA|nr:hypothetical protein QR680_002576 [Steinernema hermaphroditum]